MAKTQLDSDFLSAKGLTLAEPPPEWAQEKKEVSWKPSPSRLMLTQLLCLKRQRLPSPALGGASGLCVESVDPTRQQNLSVWRQGWWLWFPYKSKPWCQAVMNPWCQQGSHLLLATHCALRKAINPTFVQSPVPYCTWFSHSRVWIGFELLVWFLFLRSFFDS